MPLFKKKVCLKAPLLLQNPMHEKGKKGICIYFCTNAG